MKKKRLLAGILTTAMLFGMAPSYAFADDNMVPLIELIPATPTENPKTPDSTDVPEKMEQPMLPPEESVCTQTQDCPATVHLENCPSVVCNCEHLCVEETINKDCPMCSAEDAVLDEVCNGMAPIEEPPVPEVTEATAFFSESKEIQFDAPATLSESATIYVSNNGDDRGEGTEDSPYASLAKAVEQINADSNAQSYVIVIDSDLEITECARITDKHITITSANGGPYVIRRGENFQTKQDNARSTYNPAMIEVTVPSERGASLTLENIILDDHGEYEGTKFMQASTGEDKSDNQNCVQDAIVAAYGTENATAEIILDEGAVLKNFGGMSAVRVTGGATLIMKDGSQIFDENEVISDRVKGTPESNGPAGAVWVQGTNVTMQSGAEICDMIGRAFYVDGGSATIGGTIRNIKADTDMWQGVTGIGVHGRGDADIILTSTCKIQDFNTNLSSAHVIGMYGSDLDMQNGATISDIKGLMAVYTDDIGNNYQHTALINGLVDKVENNPVMRSWYGHIEIGPTGVVQNCSADQVLYTNNGSKYTISGKLLNNTGVAMYLANQSGSRVYGIMNEGAEISGTNGLAVRVNRGW